MTDGNTSARIYANRTRSPRVHNEVAAAGADTVDGVELVSERLVLRPPSELDLDFCIEMRNGPEILARAGYQPKPRSLVERQLQGWFDRWQEHGFGTWTVFDRDSDERLGRVELDPMGAGLSPGEIEVGLIVHPMHGTGASRPRRRALLRWTASVRAGLDRLVALTTTSENKASLHTLEKLGMRHRGQTHHASDPTTYQVYELAPPAPPA